MCFLPKLNQIRRSVQTISNFGGLNERASIADNEFSDCCNTSSEEYPALSVRDGYEDYIQQEMFGDMWVKSVRGYMLTHHGDSNMISFFKKGGYRHGELITMELGGVPDDIIGMDSYNNILFFLEKRNDEDAIRLVYSEPYLSNNAPIKLYCSFYYIPDTGILQDYVHESYIPVCFMAFGSRMIIACKGEIAISYHDNISDWTTYTVDGHATEECAQRIQLLDDGNFTGCTNYKDYPVFFKENSMYILYGECAPFSLSRIDSVGCPYPDTIALCNGALYFLSKLGVMEYTGGTPKLISQNINLPGTSSLSGHTGCADDRYYYISNLVFDTYTRTWSKTFPDPPALDPEKFSIQFEYYPQCCFNGQVYFLINEWTQDPAGTGPTLRSIVRTTEVSPSEWFFTTKQFHEYSEGKKIVSKLTVGFENQSATALKIEVSLDKKDFQTVYQWDGKTDFVKEVPILLPPCDYFQLRISGTGKTIVHYIKRIYRVLGG